MGPGLKGIKKLMAMWADALVEDFDIWDVTIECFDVIKIGWVLIEL